MRAIDYYELERYCIDRGLTCVPVEVIKSMADIEAEPVRYGCWRKVNYGRIAECSCCSDLFDVTDSDSIEVAEQTFKNFCTLYNYCPNCGAKMRKER